MGTTASAAASKNEIVRVGAHTVRIKRLLGEGGFSYVFLAEQVEDGRLCVLKRMRISRENDEAVDMAEAEIELMRSLAPHPNVVGFIDARGDMASALQTHTLRDDDARGVARGGGGPAPSGAGAPQVGLADSDSARNAVDFDILLEYCDGGSAFSERFAFYSRREAIPEARLLRRFRDLCLAVAHLHANGIVHRDIKAENLLLASASPTSPYAGKAAGEVSAAADPTGAAFVGKLADFGSCVRGLTFLKTASAIGTEEAIIDKTCTLAYRAPELVDLRSLLMLPDSERYVGPAADVWALGVTLYRLAFGRCPFDDSSGNTQKLAILNGKFSFPATSQYSDGFHALITSCLTLQASKRPTVPQLLQQAAMLPAWPGGHLRSTPSFRSPAVTVSSPARGTAPAAGTTAISEEPSTGTSRTARSSSVMSPARPTNAAGTGPAMAPGKVRTSAVPAGKPAQIAGSPHVAGTTSQDADAAAAGILFSGEGVAADHPHGSALIAMDGDSSADAAPFYTTLRPQGLASGVAESVGGGGGEWWAGVDEPAPAMAQSTRQPDHASAWAHSRVASAPPLTGSRTPRELSGDLRSGGPAVASHSVSEADTDHDLLHAHPGAAFSIAGLLRGPTPATSARSAPPLPSSGRRGSLGQASFASTFARRIGGAISGLAQIPSSSLVREAIQTRVMQILGGDSNRHRWVIKATSLLPGPPKGKYVRRLVLDAWETRSGGATLTFLPRRPVTVEPVVALKACALLLKLWQQGPPSALAQSQALVSMMESIIVAWDPSRRIESPSPAAATADDTAVAAYLQAYASYVASKLAFHSTHPAFDAHYCMDRIAAAITAAVDAEVKRSSGRLSGSVMDVRRAVARSESVTNAMARVSRAIGPRAVGAMPLVDALAVISKVVALLETAARVGHDALSMSFVAPLLHAGPVRTPARKPSEAGASDPMHAAAATIAGSLPPVVLESWELYQVTIAMLLSARRRLSTLGDSEITATASSLCGRVEATLPVLREFYAGVDRLYHHSTLASSLSALDQLPVLPEHSPFGDTHSEEEFLATLQVNILSPTPASNPSAATTQRPAPAAGVARVAASSRRLLVSPEAAAAAAGWPADRPFPGPADICTEPPSSLDTARAAALIRAVRGNDRCVECGDKDPTWMSVNLGIVFCLRCSGLHRQLGVHISQVRSLQLDTMRPEWAKRVLAVGNTRSNAYYEARMSAGLPPLPGASARKPRAASSMDEVARWCRDKYVHRYFAAPGLCPAEVLDAGGPRAVLAIMYSSPSAAAARGAQVQPHAVKPRTPTQEEMDAAFANVGNFDPFCQAAAVAGGQNVEDLPVPRATGAASAPAAAAQRDGSRPTVLNPEEEDSDEDLEAGEAAPSPELDDSCVQRRIDEFNRERLAHELSPARPAAAGTDDWGATPFALPPSPARSSARLAGDFDAFAAPTSAAADMPITSAAAADPWATGVSFDAWGTEPASVAAGAVDQAADPFAFNGQAPSPARQAPNVHAAAVPTAAPVGHRAPAQPPRWPAEIDIKYGDLTLGAKIGAGGFSEVYHGWFRGSEVAIKKLLVKPGDASEKATQDFVAEIVLMSELRHPNVVRLIGATADPLCLVTEFCSRGNLYDMLHNPDAALPWPTRLSIALDAARGMQYLHTHSPPVMHRDLKSLNILIDERWSAKISDFGLSRFRNTTKSTLYTSQIGTFQWMAPEVISGFKYTEKADVFSFGINLWELWTRKTPYDGMEPMQIGFAVLNRGLRPELPEDMPAAYASLVQQCWTAVPEDRPSFTHISAILAEMLGRATSGAHQ